AALCSANTANCNRQRAPTFLVACVAFAFSSCFGTAGVCVKNPGNCAGVFICGAHRVESSARHARTCGGHPRFECWAKIKAWMVGTIPAMTPKRDESMPDDINKVYAIRSGHHSRRSPANFIDGDPATARFLCLGDRRAVRCDCGRHRI